jgi:hypothetical protein
MTQSEFKRSIAKAYKFLKNIGLSKEFIIPISLPVNKDFNLIALGDACTHESIFFCGLSNNYYNFSINDYSYFHFSLTKEGNELECRMAFYPNPFSEMDESMTSPQESIIVYQELFANGDISFEELSQALSEVSPRITTPIIRYDVSYKQWKKVKHPVAHIHLGINNPSRIASDKIFTPEFFTMFVIRTFYSQYWSSNQGNDFALDLQFNSLKTRLGKVREHNFCNIEQGSLNFI